MTSPYHVVQVRQYSCAAQHFHSGNTLGVQGVVMYELYACLATSAGAMAHAWMDTDLSAWEYSQVLVVVNQDRCP